MEQNAFLQNKLPSNCPCYKSLFISVGYASKIVSEPSLPVTYNRIETHRLDKPIVSEPINSGSAPTSRPARSSIDQRPNIVTGISVSRPTPAGTITPAPPVVRSTPDAHPPSANCYRRWIDSSPGATSAWVRLRPHWFRALPACLGPPRRRSSMKPSTPPPPQTASRPSP